MSEPLATPPLRFLPLFATALAVRLLVVILGVLMIPVQPSQPIWIMGIGVAGYPADMVSSSDEDGPKQLRERIQSTSAAVIEPWYRWDAGWFCNLAENGYAKSSDGRGAAFPPAMPSVLAAANALGLNPYWAGLLAANLAGAAGAALLALIAQRLTGLALLAWLNQQPLRAGVFAALGSFARIAGVALGVAAIADWLVTDRTQRGLRLTLALAMGSVLGVICYWGYVGWVFDSPFIGLNAHSHWGRRSFSLANPWHAIDTIFNPTLFRPGAADSFAFEALCAIGFAALGIRAWLRRGIFWGMLTLVPVGMMFMSGTFLSGHRVVLAAAPAFIELADLLRNRMYYRLTVGFFVVAQLVLINRFVHWQWAG